MLKKIISLTLFLFVSQFLFAADVPKEKAFALAQNFINMQKSNYIHFKNIDLRISLKKEIFIPNTTKTALYIYDISNQGFVIISGDDNVYPVLGYSLQNTIDVNDMAPALNQWLNNYVKQISYAVENNYKASGIDEAWTYFISEIPTDKNEKNTQLGPLLLTTWNQDHFYNAYCPEDTAGPGGRVYAGCVATAMGQVMKYYNYPPQGIGSHTYYDWDYGYQTANFGNTNYSWTQMPNALNTHNNAIAELLYHCGVAVEMGYSPQGSGAQSEDVVPALKYFFGYSQNVNIKQKDDFTEQQWINMLKTNLNALMPLYYSGYSDEGGHAFNFDGYQEDVSGTRFHINWGWGGYGNGFFYINNLASPGGNFDYWHQAIFDILPASNYPSYCTGNKLIDGLIGTFEDGSGIMQYQNNTQCTWLISPSVNVINIKLSFDRFETELDNDILTVYDGEDDAAPVLGIFSGTNLPTQLTSTGKKMFLKFQTDNQIRNNGWSVSYTTTKPVYCSGVTVIQDESGTISDGSGSYNYNSNTSCRWRIEPPNAGTITLNFTEFDTQLNEDRFEVYDVSSSPYELLDVYSGSQLPPNKTYNAQKLLLWFKSANNPKAGWTLNYSSTIADIPFLLNSEDVLIYPNPTKDFINIDLKSPSNEVFVNIYNIHGQIAASYLLQNESNVLNISSLNAGFYFISILSDNKTFLYRLIKI